MVWENRGIYVFLGPSWVLITYIISPPGIFSLHTYFYYALHNFKVPILRGGSSNLRPRQTQTLRAPSVGRRNSMGVDEGRKG